MRISDWSSDVCSSDLLALGALAQQRHRADRGNRRQRVQPVQAIECAQHLQQGRQAGTAPGLEVAQRLLGNAGLVGQGQLVEVAGQAQAAELVAEAGLECFGGGIGGVHQSISTGSWRKFMNSVELYQLDINKRSNRNGGYAPIKRLLKRKRDM